MIDNLLEEIRKMAALSARDLRERSPQMDGTAIIAEEEYIPFWRADKDYSAAVVGAPVKYEEQVYALLQPHNASHYAQTPAELPALWRVKHTTDPSKAKLFVKPTSTSDMYLVDECMVYTDGKTYRCLRDTIYSPEEYSPDWERMEELDE